MGVLTSDLAERDDSARRPAQRQPTERLARRAIAVMLIQGVGAVLSYAALVLFARWLGAAVFGAFNVAIVLSQGLAVLAAGGLNMGVLRFAPAYLVSHDEGRLHGLLRFVGRAPMVTGALLGAAAAAVLFLLGAPLSYSCAMGALVPLTAYAQVGGEAVRATGAVALAYFPQFILRPVLLVVAGVLLFRVGTGAQWAVAAAVVSMLVVSLVQYGSVHHVYGPGPFRAKPRTEAAVWVRTGIPLMFMSAATYVANQADILVVGAILGFQDAGYYTAAQRSATIVGFVLFASNAVVAPSLARHFARGDIQRMRRLVVRVSRWTFAAAVACGLCMVLGAPVILGWFGVGFSQALGALVLLVSGRIVSAFAGPVGYVVGLTGHERKGAQLQAVFGAVGIVITCVLARAYGLIGAAAGSALGLTFVNVALAVVVWRQYRIAPLGLVGYAEVP